MNNTAKQHRRCRCCFAVIALQKVYPYSGLRGRKISRLGKLETGLSARTPRLVEAGGFGPPKQRCNRFTVCPLWPLGNASSYKVSVTGNIPALRQCKIYQNAALAAYRRYFVRAKHWSWWTDSNPRPADYKSAALPTELHQHKTPDKADVQTA